MDWKSNCGDGHLAATDSLIYREWVMGLPVFLRDIVATEKGITLPVQKTDGDFSGVQKNGHALKLTVQNLDGEVISPCSLEANARHPKTSFVGCPRQLHSRAAAPTESEPP